MSTVGQREIRTQQQVIKFFQKALGYEYLGHWKDRPDNSNIDVDLLTGWLERQDYDERIIGKVLRELDKAAALSGSKSLYDANRAVHSLLRYGVKIQPDVGEQHITVWLVDWGHPENNDFAIAEEVTVFGEATKRPDIVLYVNGIALGVLELKRSTVHVSEGIRQQLDSQKKDFIRPFFATVQLVMAGNDTEGLHYAVIETPEKYWLRWKEQDAHPDAGDNPLLRELSQLCHKDRLLEIVHDFVVFDAGTKKICRHSQYFAVKASQARVERREGGIIWHTQGSGKSLIMVWLAKWIREHVTDSRVLIITDRTELDDQIESVFKGVDEDIHRTKSGADLIEVLNKNEDWLVASLIHKFGASDEGDINSYLADLESHLPPGFHAKGELFVFVDECHRTQSGRLHQAMKSILPGAMFIGFTGTPLLKKDKQTSIETFGPYIHTYKFDEAVDDGVVLDLRYEARDIDQSITSPDKIDQWFDSKTRGLTDFAKAQLKQRWGTLRKVLSAEDRLEKIVADILLDMETRDRLRSGHGNAMLVSESIYSACRFFDMFSRTDLAEKCAIITSYQPSPAQIKGEESGEGLTEELLKYGVYRKMLAEHFNEPEDAAMSKVDIFEQEVKKRFIEEPGQMKLLIVVDKLLTGFDAPPATYLYIDKKMQDHGLFQAICRVNRLDGEDKEYGFIVDYKDLFRSLEESVKTYTGGAFEEYDKEDVEGLLKDRLEQGRERLEETREAVNALCEPVQPPRDTTDYLRYFCAQVSGSAEQLKDNERKRVLLYQMVGSYLRAYANLANEMREAGYSDTEAQVIKEEVSYYEKVREEVKLNSGDYIDLKMYEPAMRHLLDAYIRAEDSETLSAFDDLSLVELIVERGEEAIDSLPEGLRNSQEAVAETVENNVRRLIIDETPANPKYYEKMSDLLEALILERKQQALDYKAYLARLVGLTKRAKNPDTTSYPYQIETSPQRALYDNLKEVEALEQHVAESEVIAESDGNVAKAVALAIDEEILSVKKADWRGNRFKRREVQNAIKAVLGDDDELVASIFEIVMHQRDY